VLERPIGGEGEGEVASQERGREKLFTGVSCLGRGLECGRPEDEK